MPQFTLLYGARQLLTLRGSEGPRRGSELRELGIIENGSVLIENGLIRAVGPTRRIENLRESRDALLIDVSDRIVMPGLIDSACHITYSEPATAVHSRARRPGRLYSDALALMRASLQHGTATAVTIASAETAGFRPDIATLRQLTKVGINPVHTVRSWSLGRWPESEPELQEYLSSLEVLTRRKLFDFIQVPSRIMEGKLDAVAALVPEELPLIVKWTGAEGAPLDEILRLLGPHAVFCDAPFTPEELAVLAQWPGVCVFAPSLKFGQGACAQLRQAADAGCAVALASGYHPINSPGYSMQMAITLAIVSGNLTAEEAISAATVNGAWAAGRAEFSGTLEKGKIADLIVMSVPDYREIARQFGINNVATVLRQGEVVFNRASWRMGTHETPASGVRPQRF